MSPKNRLQQFTIALALTGFVLAAPMAKTNATQMRPLIPQQSPEEVVQGLANGITALVEISKERPVHNQFVSIAEGLDDYYNIPLIARVTAGPAWDKASKASQYEYTDLLRHYLAAKIVDRLNNGYYVDAKFKVDGVDDGNHDTKYIASQLFLINKTATAAERNRADKVTFVIKKFGNKNLIVDEIDITRDAKFSMLRTLFDEFNAVAGKKGVEGLKETLKIKTAQLLTNSVPMDR